MGRSFAEELVLAEEIGDVIASRIPAAPAPSKFPWFCRFSDVGKTNQETDVSAGKRERVFRLEIPNGRFGVIRSICSEYYEGDEVEWYVDAQPEGEKPIKRAIGNYPNTPIPWVKEVYHHVEWYVKNNGFSTHTYGIFNDGVIAKLEDREAIMERVSRGVL